MTTNVALLRQVRWGVRAALTLGVAASVAANVLHARPNPVSQVIAAWPPLALLLTVELVSRVPVGRRWLGAVRVAATVVIAGIAGWVSYWHMSGVAARYGETASSAYLLPISVDGLIVVASISLVELAGRIRAAEPAPPATAPAAVRATGPGLSTVAGPGRAAGSSVTGELVAAARREAAAHRARTGRPIGPGQLAAVLGVSEQAAKELIDHITTGTSTTAGREPRRGIPEIGELTR